MYVLLRNALEHTKLISKSLRGVSVEAFSFRDPNVIIDFNVELVALVLDLDTKDLREVAFLYLSIN